MLKNQTARIHEQAASSTIPMETLKRAFQNIYDTMDSIDAFKLKALDSMKTTVDTLSTEVEKSRGYIASAEGAAQGPLTGRTATPLTPLEGWMHPLHTLTPLSATSAPVRPPPSP